MRPQMTLCPTMKKRVLSIGPRRKRPSRSRGVEIKNAAQDGPRSLGLQHTERLTTLLMDELRQSGRARDRCAQTPDLARIRNADRCSSTERYRRITIRWNRTLNNLCLKAPRSLTGALFTPEAYSHQLKLLKLRTKQSRL